MDTLLAPMFSEDQERIIRRLIKKLKLSRDSVILEAQHTYNRHTDPFQIKKRDERDLYKLGKRKREYDEREERKQVEKVAMARGDVALMIENRRQIILYSRAIITALEDTLDYDPIRHHNQTPPALYLPDAAYLNEIRLLAAELRTLNKLIVASKLYEAEPQVGPLAKHLDEFLSNYSQSLGKAAAALTAASIVALLYQTGVGREIVEAIARHVK